MTYRLAWARTGAYLLGGAAIAAVVCALLWPSFLPFTVFVCAFAWLAALAWSFPKLRLNDGAIIVRNPFSTTTIPFAAVTHVTGGNRLEIESRGGVKVVAAAVPGGGNFTMAATRKVNTYGAFLDPVTSVDNLRIDAGEPDTPSTRIADIIRRRVAIVGGQPKITDAAVRRLNVGTIAGTVAIVAVGVIGLIIR